VLTPGQEISPLYLRTLRQTLRDIILPEVKSPAGRNAANLCDYIFVRMIAALEELPQIQAAHSAGYERLMTQAAQLTGTSAPVSGKPVWGVAKDVQTVVPALFEKLSSGSETDARAAAKILAQIGAEEASFRKDYETAYKNAESKSEPLPLALLVSADAAQKYLDHRFGGEVRITNCHQIPGGRSKLTVLLSVEPNKHIPEDMVMRIDGPGSAINTTVLDEFPILDAMFKAGVSAPEPLWVETNTKYLGAPFLVMRRMPGAAAGDLWGAQKVAPTIGLALAEALASVHKASVPAIWPDAPRDARDAVRNMIASFENSWRDGGDVTHSLGMETAYGWLRRNLPCIDGPTVAVHGDAHFANLLAENDKLVCLLDWEFTHPGHAADDLAYCRPYVETIMPWNDFLAHYRDHGGRAVTDEQLRFFDVWGYLRNITFGANMLRDFAGGKVHGIQNLAIALNTRAKLEALLSKTISAALARDAENAKP
jgi:aminoglycoside phosphotransferase (APT) family kinase protein